MTPLAKAEFHRYCEDIRKSRRANEPLSFADLSDYVVGAVVGIFILLLTGAWIGEELRPKRFQCPTHLPDGRALNAWSIKEDGSHTACRYEAPPLKWRKS